MTTDTAPIILFVYARPAHTQRTLEALAANLLADSSDLIVYADAARHKADAGQVQTVRDLARAASGFRNVTIIERETNYGLARNIIEGITEVCSHYDRVIVLEDDIVTSRNFLSFMNIALERYTDEQRVWHVSGWNYPIAPEELGEAFFWRVMNCWGWATWADRWKHYQKDPDRLIRNWNSDIIKRFNLDGAHDFWSQVTANHSGKMNTWAIFWYATIFENNGLCLNPVWPLVRNIGHDGTGENCGRQVPFIEDRLTTSNITELPGIFDESNLAIARIKAFYESLHGISSQKIYQYLKKLIGFQRENG